MRFDYETKQDDRECVAFVCESGHLAIRGETGGCIMIKNGGDGPYSGSVGFDEWLRMCQPQTRFKTGDKLTITF